VAPIQHGHESNEGGEKTGRWLVRTRQQSLDGLRSRHPDHTRDATDDRAARGIVPEYAANSDDNDQQRRQRKRAVESESSAHGRRAIVDPCDGRPLYQVDIQPPAHALAAHLCGSAIAWSLASRAQGAQLLSWTSRVDLAL
jgi:hypothetical protein